VTAIGVLCARVRVEEKQIIAAIGEAGLVAVPVPPASMPLPLGPASRSCAVLGEFLDAASGESIDVPVSTLIDRAANRAVAASTLPLVRACGVRTLDAGIAATGTRLQVASALAASGVARPDSLVGFSEDSAVEGVRRLGYPATLFGLMPGSASTSLLDADTADAVIEHRVVLGEDSEAIVLLQAGAPSTGERSIVHVIGGEAIAFAGKQPDAHGLDIARDASRAIQASIAAIEIATIDGRTVVWDVHPVADFRTSTLLGETTVATAIAKLAGSPAHSHIASPLAMNEEVHRGVALSA
jgi:hypothetical protein